MFRPFRLLTAAVLLVAALVPSVAHGKAQIAISDNKPDMFTDPAWKALKTQYSRVVVSWNVMTPKTSAGKQEKARLAQWMAGAKANGQSVLVSLNSSRDKRRGPAEPKTDKQYTSAVKALKKQYPQIKAISPWNEASYVQRKPKELKRVVNWTKLAKKSCKRCKIVMNVVDKPNLNSWTKKYIKLSKKTKGSTVKIWGLNNYVDVNNFTDKRTKAFMKIAKGQIWLTETGGVVGRSNGQSSFAGTGVDHQTKATTYLFDNIVKKQPRIKYVFIYNWDNEIADFPSRYITWDSALRAHSGVLRPAYNVILANK